jgi:hypothetical protein
MLQVVEPFEPIGVERHLIADLYRRLEHLSERVGVNAEAIENFVGLVRAEPHSRESRQIADFYSSIGENIRSLNDTIAEMQETIREHGFGPEDVV